MTGAHDVDAAALGIGAISAGSASVVLGTFSINQVVADRPVLDRRWQARAFIDAGRWLHMSTSPAGAANLDWVAQLVGPWTPAGLPDLAAAVERATATPVELDSPFFLPFLYGSPHPAALGASFIGLRGWHGDGDVLRAVVEGVAFNHRTHMDALREKFEITEAVRVCGGGARSPEWTQLLADVLDMPLEITDATEAGARGAALLAGIGIGAFSDLGQAADVAVRVVRRHTPRAEAVDLMAKRYETYLAVVQSLSTTLP